METMATESVRVAIACQGGGSHTAFTGGVLEEIIRHAPARYDIIALSGTSGGAMCATLAWDGLRRDDPDDAVTRLTGFWDDMAATDPLDRTAASLTLWGQRLFDDVVAGSLGISPFLNPAARLGQRRLREAIDRHVGFDDAVRTSPPHLFVGAVNAETGRFEVFTDDPDGPTALKVRPDGLGGTVRSLADPCDALLASAAYPYVFPAVEIAGRDGAPEGHWDGLFSQNPPIRHFTIEEEVSRKPDQIWLVRINPRRVDRTPRSIGEIAHRRNALAGNISVHQELHAIETVNDFIANGVIDDDRYRQIEIREIGLQLGLDHHSKLDRTPALLERLRERGRTAAPALWGKDSSG